MNQSSKRKGKDCTVCLKHLIIEGCLCFVLNKDCILRLSVLLLQNKHYISSFEIGLVMLHSNSNYSNPSISCWVIMVKAYTFREVPPLQNIRVWGITALLPLLVNATVFRVGLQSIPHPKCHSHLVSLRPGAGPAD